jgi:hypothetical protein
VAQAEQGPVSRTNATLQEDAVISVRWFLILGCAMVFTPSNAHRVSNHPKPSQELAKRAPKAASRTLRVYGKLPLSFEGNQGQTDRQVKFLSRGKGYTLFLTKDEAVFSLRGGKNESRLTSLARPRPRSETGAAAAPSATLRMKLVNANPAAEIAGSDELPGKSNYFLGNDPKKWRTNVPTYAKVKYRNVYSGIDLLYYGNQGQLEYDFAVAPGADPGRIQLDIRGAKSIRRDAQGDLVLQIAGSEVRWRKPVVYQERDGARQEIAGRYVIKRGHRVGFEVASYDRTSPLVIDPAITYSTYLGGATSFADAYSVAVDAAGNAYLTGYTRAWDFPVTQGAFQTSCPSGNGQYGCGTWGAAFITKMNPTGTALVYSTYLGGNEGAQGDAIAVDAAGDAYVTGGTDSNNFPTTPGAFQTTCSNCGYYQGLGDAFVTELNPTGSALVNSTYLGGNTASQTFNNSNGDGVAIDTSGNVYVVGLHEFRRFSGYAPCIPEKMRELPRGTGVGQCLCD